MENEIKTEDIIKSLRACAQGNPDACAACVYSGTDTCYEELCEDAADRLKQLSNQHIKIQYNNEELTISELCSRMDRLREKLNAAKMENELLRGALASCGVPENAGAVRIKADQRTEHFAGASKMVPEDERIMRQAIETYGVQAQCDVAVEEMAELTQVVMKIRRISDDYEETMAARDHLIDEIADVGIMIDQMELMFGAVDVEKMRRKKLLRLKKHLELEGADEK